MWQVCSEIVGKIHYKNTSATITKILIANLLPIDIISIHRPELLETAIKIMKMMEKWEIEVHFNKFIINILKNLIKQPRGESFQLKPRMPS